MQKGMKCLHRLMAVTIIIVHLPAFVFCDSQEHENSLDLNPQQNAVNPKEFYISNVSDSRKVKGAIGVLVQSVDIKDQKRVNQPIYLKGGTIKSVNQFISGSLTSRSDLRPVTYNIKVLRISENLQSTGNITGRIEMIVSFQLDRNGIRVDLVEYKGGSTYVRSENNKKVLEQLVAGTIVNSLRFFDKWINLHISTNELLADKANITFSDFNPGFDPDTLFYSKNQKLAWTDFKGEPNLLSRFEAEIFPFFSFEQNARINNGVVEIDLALKTYLVKSFSWVKDGARTPYTLNHEQRHFDIVKIISENFKDKIRAENLTVENYQGILAVEYLESLREMNRLQVQYDLETKHGINAVEQRKWNAKIDDQLSKSGKVKARL